MMAELPPGIDKSEGNIPWDFTRPSALEKARFVEFHLNETIRLIFPQWSYDGWLDLHAEKENVLRRAANRASGTVCVTGTPGLTIPAGFQFATPATLTPSVLFETLEETVLSGTPDSRGLVTADISIQAVEGGLIGNVANGTVKLMVRPLTGISLITNPEPLTGGAPAESDASLLQRLLEALRRGMSFTGCDADYVRWAKEVPGVGQAFTQAEWDGPGTVRVLVIDATGLPANQQILDAVYEHIISPNDRMKRLAPIGATLTVAAHTPLYIDITADVTLRAGENIDTVTDRFKVNLDLYWLEATTEHDFTDVQSGAAQNSVKIVFIGSTLAQTAGISNYAKSTLSVNGGAADIVIPVGQFPVTREVKLNE
jgi:uncharacterized phage protein gp47/JayE